MWTIKMLQLCLNWFNWYNWYKWYNWHLIFNTIMTQQSFQLYIEVKSYVCYQYILLLLSKIEKRWLSVLILVLGGNWYVHIALIMCALPIEYLNKHFQSINQSSMPRASGSTTPMMRYRLPIHLYRESSWNFVLKETNIIDGHAGGSEKIRVILWKILSRCL